MPNGVVGYTKLGCSNHYTQVISVLHSEFVMQVRHKNTNHECVMEWTESDGIHTATLVKVENYVEMQKGDSIISAGTLGKFPNGEFVGYVESVITSSGSNFVDIKVKLATDFNKVYNVHVIRNTQLLELQEIQADANNVMKEVVEP